MISKSSSSDLETLWFRDTFSCTLPTRSSWLQELFKRFAVTEESEEMRRETFSHSSRHSVHSREKERRNDHANDLVYSTCRKRNEHRTPNLHSWYRSTHEAWSRASTTHCSYLSLLSRSGHYVVLSTSKANSSANTATLSPRSTRGMARS